MTFSSARARQRRRAAPLLLLLTAACFSADHRLYELQLAGTIDIDPAYAPAAGRIFVQVHHQSRGEGALRRPLGLIDSFELDAPGAFEQLLTVPIDEGEGLVVYAWLDRDGDGLLCAPGAAPEPTAAIDLSAAFPVHQLDLALTLRAPCVGPERALSEP